MRMATSSSTRRGRQSGADLKPPQAAVVKSDGGERCGKVGTRFRQAKSAKLANENCDRAVTLNQTLSAQLREAQDRINQLEREAAELGEQLLMEARAIIQEVQSNADGRVKRTIREA